MTSADPRRTFTLIQALRGFAASWVVLFHIAKGENVTGLTAHLPHWLSYIVFDYGSAGVAVFFVLSGFVISHSLAGRAMDGRGYLRFIARRSLRLDPPYWASMLLTVAVGAAFAHAKHLPFASPSFGTVIGHVFYLQELLRLPEIGLVYWSLTYEIQFYLVLAAAWWLITALVARGRQAQRVELAVMLPLGALALVPAALGGDWALHGLFLNLWHGFVLGMLAYEAGVRRRWTGALIVLAVVAFAGAFRTEVVFGVPCAITAIGLWLAGRTSYLDHGLASRGWQFLGRVSYSLYLIHVPMLLVGWGVWHRLAGRSFAADTLGLIVIGAIVVLAAAAFWWAVERPAHALSARLLARKVEPALSLRL